MSSASAREFVQRRAKRSRAGPSCAKQVFQSSSVSVLSMSSSRSFRLRRRQMQLLSNPMKLLFGPAVAFLTFLAAAGTSAETPALNPNARSLAAAETAFAHESETSGMRTAFLHALSDDGIVFQPNPQHGRKAWKAKKDSGGL